MAVSKQPYTKPVSRLMELGDVRRKIKWRNYLALGFTELDVPELGRMILDEDLWWADCDSDEVWSAVHAWRTLAQLKAESAIPDLMELLGRLDKYQEDWASGELPIVFAHIGQAAIEPLRTFLADSGQGLWSLASAGHSLAEIGQRHPELRAECVAVLSRQLEDFARQENNFNGILIGDLLDLKGVEAAPIIEQAFAANKVDLLAQESWEEVRIYLGLPGKHKTPSPDSP